MSAPIQPVSLRCMSDAICTPVVAPAALLATIAHTPPPVNASERGWAARSDSIEVAA